MANTPLFEATVKNTLACGDLVNLKINGSASGKSFNVPFDLRTGNPSIPVTQASSDVPMGLYDGWRGYYQERASELVVSESDFVNDLNITIGNLTHTWVGDVEIRLTSPSGTTVLLFDKLGGDGDNLSNTVFDDAAKKSITIAAAPFTGAYKPIEPLSVFNGEQMRGTWKLLLRDTEEDDYGTLNSWSMTRKGYDCS